MKNLFSKAVVGASTLEDVKVKVIEVLKKINKESPDTKIGYVAGIITSDGPEKLDSNLERLGEYTQKLQKTNNFPIFSSTEIFSSKLARRIDIERYSQKEWLKYWQDIVGSGYVTDIFMTPRWEGSRGVNDEYKTAKKHNLKIHFVDKDFLTD